MATLAYNELLHRNKEKTANRKFSKANLHPIPWLESARKSLSILEMPKEGKYQGHLYVILKSGFTKSNGFYGAYVGSSKLKPENRFKEHKAGIRSARGIPERGEQLLRSLLWPWRTVPGAKKERVEWESALNRCLSTVVPKVHGDSFPIEKWPEDFQKPLKRLIQKEEF
jgi:hypothetical protein